MYKATVNFVKLSSTAQAPTSGSEYAAGYDLHADFEADYIVLHPGEMKKISTGIAIALPEGTFGALYPRSGLATKKGLVLANTVGIIDSDYRGPVIAAIRNVSSEVQIIERGERIVQLVVTPYCPAVFNETDSIGTTARGENGFGSSGTK